MCLLDSAASLATRDEADGLAGLVREGCTHQCVT